MEGGMYADSIITPITTRTTTATASTTKTATTNNNSNNEIATKVPKIITTSTPTKEDQRHS